jgi:hypothetical protein
MPWGGAVQAALQPPQCAGSIDSVTHLPPQTVWPSWHVTPPSPLAPPLPALPELPPLLESGKLLVGTHWLLELSHT